MATAVVQASKGKGEVLAPVYEQLNVKRSDREKQKAAQLNTVQKYQQQYKTRTKEKVARHKRKELRAGRECKLEQKDSKKQKTYHSEIDFHSDSHSHARYL